MAPPFGRAAVIENPGSGQPNARRKAALRAVFAALQAAGVPTEHLVIDGPGSGSQLARQAIRRGCDAVLVCGGDGTVHEVLQPLVGTGVALGVVPMGTANALAADLGLPRSPHRAIQALLAAQAVPVPVGRILFRQPSGAPHARYFTVAAGVGADALLMARMNPALKRRLGYALYVIEAFRLWISHSFPLFEARFASGDAVPHVLQASQLLAVRVRSFGGALGKLAPGASLHADDLRLVAFKTRSRMRYLHFLLAVIAGRPTFTSHIELIAADAVECIPPPGHPEPIYVEADGELLGSLPVRIELASERLTLLIPPNAKP